jgi:hypothetical protein
MKKVTDVKSNCRHHFVLVSIGPFEARVYKLIVSACRDASVRQCTHHGCRIYYRLWIVYTTTCRAMVTFSDFSATRK